MSSFPLLISGFVLKVLGILSKVSIHYVIVVVKQLNYSYIVASLLIVSGIPFSKPLYTLSYMFVTAGASGFVLTVVFYIVS